MIFILIDSLIDNNLYFTSSNKYFRSTLQTREITLGIMALISFGLFKFNFKFDWLFRGYNCLPWAPVNGGWMQCNI